MRRLGQEGEGRSKAKISKKVKACRMIEQGQSGW